MVTSFETVTEFTNNLRDYWSERDWQTPFQVTLSTIVYEKKDRLLPTTLEFFEKAYVILLKDESPSYSKSDLVPVIAEITNTRGLDRDVDAINRLAYVCMEEGYRLTDGFEYDLSIILGYVEDAGLSEQEYIQRLSKAYERFRKSHL